MNTPLAGMGRLRPSTFFLGLLLLCASTLMYEIALTRLLSVVSWYYLAFVSISMAMFGMTAGALAVQFRPDLFTADLIPKRLVQSALAMAISLPLSLMTMLAVPLYTSFAAQTVYNFLLFSAIISVPFFFSGIAVCLSLTRMPFPMGRIYFADLMGAALGCIGSVILLGLLDAPSAIFMISALLFSSSALYAAYAGESRPTKTAALLYPGHGGAVFTQCIDLPRNPAELGEGQGQTRGRTSWPNVGIRFPEFAHSIRHRDRR